LEDASFQLHPASTLAHRPRFPQPREFGKPRPCGFTPVVPTGAVWRVATAKKRCMPRLIPSLGRPLKLFIQAGGRSIKASSVLSAENSVLGCESSANQPRRTASIGPLSVASHAPRHSPFLTAFRYPRNSDGATSPMPHTSVHAHWRRSWGSASFRRFIPLDG